MGSARRRSRRVVIDGDSCVKFEYYDRRNGLYKTYFHGNYPGIAVNVRNESVLFVFSSPSAPVHGKCINHAKGRESSQEERSGAARNY